MATKQELEAQVNKLLAGRKIILERFLQESKDREWCGEFIDIMKDAGYTREELGDATKSVLEFKLYTWMAPEDDAVQILLNKFETLRDELGFGGGPSEDYSSEVEDIEC